MATTLQQLAAASTDKLVQGFINEIAADSYILGNMPFDDCLTPSGTSDLVYAYSRVTTPASAAFRALDAEPDASNAQITKYTAKVAVLNSNFTIDRVAAKAAPSLLDMKLGEAKNAIIRKFNSALINGDVTEEQYGFDGLSKALTDSSTEVASSTDISDASAIASNALAFASEMDDMLSLLDGDPSAILVGRSMKVKLSAIARALGIYQTMPDEVGRPIGNWAGVPVIALKDGAITSNDVYAVRFGMDGFHGVTLTGGNAITVTVPDLSQAGAIHKGDAEFVCGVALKATKAAGVLRVSGADSE